MACLFLFYIYKNVREMLIKNGILGIRIFVFYCSRWHIRKK